VGRVEYLYLNLLNFSEFLLAIGQERAFEKLDQIPIQPFAHNTLLDLLIPIPLLAGCRKS